MTRKLRKHSIQTDRGRACYVQDEGDILLNSSPFSGTKIKIGGKHDKVASRSKHKENRLKYEKRHHFFLPLTTIDTMGDRIGVECSLPPFDVVVCSSWLAMRKCQCPAHIAQSAATPAAVNNGQVPVAGMDPLVIASGCQQQDKKFPVVNGSTK